MILWTTYSSYFGVPGFIAALVFSAIFDAIAIYALASNRRERIREQYDSSIYAVSNAELIAS
jgi:hypothetical protein